MTAIEKFEIIKPYLEGEIILKDISTQSGQSIRTLRRWIKQYRKDGLNGLERKKRSDKNKKRSITTELEALTKALALSKPKLSITTIQRKIKKLAQEKGLPAPKYNVIYNIVNDLKPSLITLVHEGSVAYRDKYELIYRREIGKANETWQADHTPLDILLLNEKEEAFKPWLTIVEDDYSRAISGYYLSFDHPSGINTALALRQAIWRKTNPAWQVCGIPEKLYTDNGSDFICEHIQQVGLALKIQLVNSIPGRPQGKGKVERFFLTLLQQLLEGLPGYAPAGAVKVKASLTLAQFSVVLEKFILNTYHKTPHGTTGMAPIDRWNGDGFLPRLPQSVEQLDGLLLTVPKSRKVHRDGIRFKQFRYISPTLAGFIGEQVIIRYDPRDLAEIRVYLDKTFICTAICQDIADLVVSLRDIRKARQKEKRQLRKQINDAQQLLKKISNDTTDLAASLSKKSVKSKPKKFRIKLYKNE
jgi:putative transposase